jgi:hypothetical protein
MASWVNALFGLLALSILLSAATTTIQEGDYGTATRAKYSVACILKMVEGIYPIVVLAMVVIGGIEYLSAAGDNQKRVMGKKYIIMGLVGGMIVVSLLYVSCDVGFGAGNTICPSDCRAIGAAGGGGGGPGGAPAMVSPPSSTILT